MRELDYKESWVLKNWTLVLKCFWIVVLDKTLESPLDCMDIKPVHPKGNHSWIFIGRTDVEAETPILWPPDVKSWLIWKDPDAGKDWMQEEKGMTKDEMVGWHHRLNGREFEHAPGVGDGQGGLASCSSWGRKESDLTEWLNWTEGSLINNFFGRKFSSFQKITKRHSPTMGRQQTDYLIRPAQVLNPALTLFSLWPQEGYLMFPSLSFTIYKMEIITTHCLQIFLPLL